MSFIWMRCGLLNRGCDVAERLCWSSVMGDLCGCFMSNLITSSVIPETTEALSPHHTVIRKYTASISVLSVLKNRYVLLQDLTEVMRI